VSGIFSDEVKNVVDNEQYWVKRHEQLEGSLASVGQIGTPEAENRQRYARKKRRVFNLLREIGMTDLAGRSALDAGCGTGMISEFLYALGADVHGVDASPIAIAEARDRASPDSRDDNRFVTGSIIDFRFDQRFDLTFCLDVLYHVVDDANWERTLTNLLAHTKPGGHLIIIERLKPVAERPSSHVRWRTRAMYDLALGGAGGINRTPENQPGFLVYVRPDA
jgi:2-polyprenyl-3-methyl-5-hydroxy-6-metoxy-1,4-benzoquinol methylase